MNSLGPISILIFVHNISNTIFTLWLIYHTLTIVLPRPKFIKQLVHNFATPKRLDTPKIWKELVFFDSSILGLKLPINLLPSSFYSVTEIHIQQHTQNPNNNPLSC